MGSDDPYDWVPHPVDPIFTRDALDDSQKAAILGETAAKILDL